MSGLAPRWMPAVTGVPRGRIAQMGEIYRINRAGRDATRRIQPSAAALRAIASSAEEIPTCAADHATGPSRKLLTWARLDSENAGRSLHASSTSHHVHK